MPYYSPISREATSKGIAEQLAEQHRVSTDPRWLAPFEEKTPQNGAARTAKPEEQAAPPEGPVRRPPKPDGRRLRKDESRALLLAACRGLMAAGVFRPDMPAICAAAGRAVRTGFDVFGGTGEIHTAAIADVETRDAVIARLVDSPELLEDSEIDNIIRAVIKGR